ncbi:MAG: PP0621 family protein [Gammaproteobacteria bacterium]
MKYLLVVAVVLVAFWIWRNNRRQEQAQRQTMRPPATTSTPVRMVACHHCGTHLPETDAVAGSLGVYCSQAHLLKEEPHR